MSPPASPASGRDASRQHMPVSPGPSGRVDGPQAATVLRQASAAPALGGLPSGVTRIDPNAGQRPEDARDSSASLLRRPAQADDPEGVARPVVPSVGSHAMATASSAGGQRPQPVGHRLGVLSSPGRDPVSAAAVASPWYRVLAKSHALVLIGLVGVGLSLWAGLMWSGAQSRRQEAPPGVSERAAAVGGSNTTPSAGAAEPPPMDKPPLVAEAPRVPEAVLTPPPEVAGGAGAAAHGSSEGGARVKDPLAPSLRRLASTVAASHAATGRRLRQLQAATQDRWQSAYLHPRTRSRLTWYLVRAPDGAELGRVAFAPRQVWWHAAEGSSTQAYGAHLSRDAIHALAVAWATSGAPRR